MKSIAIIPAYNECFTIASLVYMTKKYVDLVIVIDDGSQDDTSEIAKAAGAEVYTLLKNSGKATAIIKGIKEAILKKPDVIVMLDADGQHNPNEIPTLIRPIIENKYDFVIGSRFLSKEHNVPKYRRIGQVILDQAVDSGNTEITDTQSGFRSFGKLAYPYLLKINSYGYNIELDMINILQNGKIRITEVPINVRYENLPSIHKKNSILHGFDVVTYIFGLIGYERPLLCFGLPGLISLLIGIILGFVGFNIYNMTKMFPISYAMMSVLLIISGLLLGMTALMLNAIDVIFKRLSNK